MSQLSISELQRLQDDEQYREDMQLTYPEYVSFCEQKTAIEVRANELALQNIKMAEDFQ